MSGSLAADQSADDRLSDFLYEKYEPVAIVGIGLRFPGGNDTPEGFAEFLRQGRSGLGPLPTDRWDAEAFLSEDPAAKGVIRCAAGGFLEGVDRFDARFFNISPKEADFVDPQQRLALEVAWEALEDAGIDPTPLRHGDGAVYMAVSNMDYAAEMSLMPAEELNSYIGTGMAHSAVSGRLSYFLGWRGPSITVDTACSASLVAVHLGVQALRGGECGIALCGGVNTIHSPRGHVLATQSSMLAADGRCKTFDDSADGYCRSEGAGVVVLKRVSDALRSGDRIYALIRGSAVRQDGESSALMAPSGTAQQDLLRAALAGSLLEPADISYVEAHGTGTSLGDPIEISALSAVFGRSHSPANPLTVGSLKTNLGHMEAAAGIGGLIKTALQLRDGEIYPHLNLTTPSRHIPWESAPVTVPVEGTAWSAPVRRALVDSFGFAGTIASVVLEEPPASSPARPEEDAPPLPAHVFTLSARTDSALRRQAERYRAHLEQRPDLGVEELCQSAHLSRAHFAERAAAVVRDREGILALLDHVSGRPARDTARRTPEKVAFLFSGGGSQYPGMGAALYEQAPAFREHLDACDELFAGHFGRSITELILGRSPRTDDLHQITYMQPALFAFEYAAAQQWLAWGVRPDVMIGHSIGEIAAATVGGMFTLPDAVTLMSARAFLMADTEPGGMAAVETPEADLLPLLADHPDLALAAVNGPSQCVLSGASGSLEAVLDVLSARGVRTKRVAVSCAAHSPLMAPAAPALAEVVRSLTPGELDLALISGLTGESVTSATLADPEYWARHLCEPVRFGDAMRAAEQRGRHTFLEVGPATDMLGMGKICVNAADHAWLGTAHPEDTDGTVARGSLAQLYTAGIQVDWAAVHRGRPRRTVPLPTYPFERRRHWLPAVAPGAVAGSTAAGHPLLGRDITTAEQREAGERVFAAALSPSRPGHLADHAVLGRVVFPGAGYVEILLAAQDAVFGETGRVMTDVRIHEALILDAEQDTEIRTRIYAPSNGDSGIEIVSLAGGEGAAVERRHVSAVVTAPGSATADRDLPEAAGRLDAVEKDLRAAAHACGEPVGRRDAQDLYSDFADLGVVYGPAYQGLHEVVRYADLLAVGRLAGPTASAGTTAEILPPTILDCAFQTMAALADDDDVAMPVQFDRCRFFKKPRGAELTSLLRMRAGEPEADDTDGPTADVLILDGDRTVFVLEGLRLRRVAGAAANRDRMYSDLAWSKRELRPADAAAAAPAATAGGQVLLVRPPETARAVLVEVAAETGTELFLADSPEEIAAALRRDDITDVCWFWQPAEAQQAAVSADSTDSTDSAVAALRRECENNFTDLLGLLDRLQNRGPARDPRLWLVTEHAQTVPGDPVDDDFGAPAAATLWGFGHVMWTEYPSYRVTLVDVPRGDYRRLAEEWRAGDAPEFQVAHRAGGARHVRRIRPVSTRPDSDFELTVTEPGRLDSIGPVPLAEVPAPVGDEVEIRVHAAGLNFKDVLNALGLHRQYADRSGEEFQELPLGLECAGVVTAAGPQAAFAVGDEVVAAHLGTLKQRITVSSDMVFGKPRAMGFAEAAALPTAFLTAEYALRNLADLKAGDKVLIHAAAGGVGQAAVQLALHAGAEVFATASPRKWPLLRAQGLRHIMSSRSLDFADQILEQTGGTGVDVVLNSLSKEYVEAGVRALALGGRFVELGKMGVWTAEEFGRARPDAAFHTFDFAALSPQEARTLTRDVLGPVFELIESGELTALPTTAYRAQDPEEVHAAFGTLSRGENVGKVVLDFGTGRPDVAAAPPAALDPDAVYLITGGLGALGQLTAEQFALLGARHIAVVSRSADPERTAVLSERLGPDVDLGVHVGDVAEPDDVARLADELRGAGRPLGGIVHAAGTLADAPVSALSWDRLDGVFRSKVYGGLLLHQMASSFPELRFFVGYSSVAAVVGSRGQANYAAANAYLDELMRRRRARGEAGLSVGWGAWGEIGLAAAMDAQHTARVEDQGFRFFKPLSGMRALLRVLDGSAAHVIIADVDWGRYAATRPLANSLYQRVARDQGPATALTVDREALLALSTNDRRAAISETVRTGIAGLLHYDGADDIPAEAKFFELGMDSLVAVELKNRLEAAFGMSLPAQCIFDNPSAPLLAAYLDDRLAEDCDKGGAAEPDPPLADAALPETATAGAGS
ncbi:MAG: type I polyketide synthase [Catenulispora sp.]|nr:type I polyketide synthase [Catenulispora sp.]